METCGQLFFEMVNFIQSLNTKYIYGAKIAPLKVFQSPLDSTISGMSPKLAREQARTRNCSPPCFLCKCVSH
jgi:hypothetical protein